MLKLKKRKPKEIQFTAICGHVKQMGSGKMC